MSGAGRLLLKRVAYRALEIRHGFRGVPREINREVIRLPAAWSRYYPRSYELEKARFLRSRIPDGATVLDLGAHMGSVVLGLAHGASVCPPAWVDQSVDLAGEVIGGGVAEFGGDHHGVG